MTDATTGHPVERYTLIPGSVYSGNERLYWDRSNAITVERAHFEYDFGEAFDSAREAYALRIEAEGYRPFNTPLFEAETTAATRSFALEPAADHRTRQVLLPDGRPAAATAVYTVLPGEGHFDLAHGRLRQPSKPFAFVTADAQGVFTLRPTDESAHQILLHPQGYALLAPDEVQRAEPMRLVAWGRLEGRLLRAGAPLANQRVRLYLTEPQRFGNLLGLEAMAMTDSEGRFVLEHLPAEPLWIVHDVPSDRNDQDIRAIRQQVTITPGETTLIQLGGDGSAAYRAVVGTLQVPNLPEAYQVREISLASYAPWYVSEKDPGHQFTAQLAENGRFQFHDIPAGIYHLTFWASLPASEDPWHLRSRASIDHPLTVVPAPGANAAIDLGSIAVPLQAPNEARSDVRVTDRTPVDDAALHVSDSRRGAGIHARLDGHRQITLMALARDGRWWQPDGAPVQGITVAREHWPEGPHHTLALLRLEGDAFDLDPATLDRSSVRPFARLARVGQSAYYLAVLEHRTHRRANLMMDALWLAGPTPKRQTVLLRNIALHPGPIAPTEVVVHGLDGQVKAVEPARELEEHPAFRNALTHRLPDDMLVHFVGLAQAMEGGVRLWSPAGQPLENPGILEADVEGRGLLAAVRIAGPWPYYFASRHRRHGSLEYVTGSTFLPAIDLWLIELTVEGGAILDRLMLQITAGKPQPVLAIPLTAADRASLPSRWELDGVPFSVAGLTVEAGMLEVSLHRPEGQSLATLFVRSGDGALHEAVGSSFGGAGSQHRFDLPIDALAELVFQRRQRTEVELRGFAQAPGGVAAPHLVARPLPADEE